MSSSRSAVVAEAPPRSTFELADVVQAAGGLNLLHALAFEAQVRGEESRKLAHALAVHAEIVLQLRVMARRSINSDRLCSASRWATAGARLARRGAHCRVRRIFLNCRLIRLHRGVDGGLLERAKTSAELVHDADAL
jgi:hypothetical protein